MAKFVKRVQDLLITESRINSNILFLLKKSNHLFSSIEGQSNIGISPLNKQALLNAMQISLNHQHSKQVFANNYVASVNYLSVLGEWPSSSIKMRSLTWS